MYRKVDDFITDWKQSSSGTLHVLQTITDNTLDVSIVEGHNSLGWLAWHLTGAAGAFAQFAGIDIEGIDHEKEQPKIAHEIAAIYKQVANDITREAEKLTDASLTEKVAGFTGLTERGKLLANMISHQTHHVGQMTVLLRQAGLHVPPVMGPTKEMK